MVSTCDDFPSALMEYDGISCYLVFNPTLLSVSTCMWSKDQYETYIKFGLQLCSSEAAN